jgi:hypothetical protein
MSPPTSPTTSTGARGSRPCPPAPRSPCRSLAPRCPASRSSRWPSTSLTCSDDGGGVDGNGLISGTVFLAEPVEGAVVTVNRWDGGDRRRRGLSCHHRCRRRVRLPVGQVLRHHARHRHRRPHHRAGRRAHASRQLGPARAAARPPAPAAAHHPPQPRLRSDRRARHRPRHRRPGRRPRRGRHPRARAPRVRISTQTPIAVAPKPVDAATAFDEPARVALVLRGLGEYAHTAAVDQAVTVQAVNTRALLDQLVKDATSAEARSGWQRHSRC